MIFLKILLILNKNDKFCFSLILLLKMIKWIIKKTLIYNRPRRILVYKDNNDIIIRL